MTFVIVVTLSGAGAGLTAWHGEQSFEASGSQTLKITKLTILNVELLEFCEERSQGPYRPVLGGPTSSCNGERRPGMRFCYDGRSGRPVGTAGN
jgi:hypothetical protein